MQLEEQEQLQFARKGIELIYNSFHSRLVHEIFSSAALRRRPRASQFKIDLAHRVYVHTPLCTFAGSRSDDDLESDSHYGDSELPPNKIPRMDMDERKRFACRAKNPLCSAGKSITASFFSPGLFQRFPTADWRRVLSHINR